MLNMTFVDSDISLAVSTRMPYCPRIKDWTVLPSSMRKINQIVAVSNAHAIEVQWVTCRGFYPYFHIMNY